MLVVKSLSRLKTSQNYTSTNLGKHPKSRERPLVEEFPHDLMLDSSNIDDHLRILLSVSLNSFSGWLCRGLAVLIQVIRSVEHFLRILRKCVNKLKVPEGKFSPDYLFVDSVCTRPPGHSHCCSSACWVCPLQWWILLGLTCSDHRDLGGSAGSQSFAPNPSMLSPVQPIQRTFA